MGSRVPLDNVMGRTTPIHIRHAKNDRFELDRLIASESARARGLKGKTDGGGLCVAMIDFCETRPVRPVRFERNHAAANLKRV